MSKPSKRAGAPGSAELTREQLDRLDYCITQMCEAFNDRFVLTAPKYLERYLRGEVCIHAHFRRAGEPNAEKLCATFYGPDNASTPLFGDDLKFALLEWGSGNLEGVHLNIITDECVTADDQQQFMLVDVIQAMKNGERMICRKSAVVRLRSLDNCTCSTGYSLYRSLTNCRFIFRDCEADGKMDFERGRLMPCEYKRPNQMVKGRTQMSNDFSSANRKFQGSRWWSDDLMNILGSVSIMLTNESVRMQIKEGFAESIEPIDIVIGPLDLRPTPFEWR